MRAERTIVGTSALGVLGILGALVPKCPLCFAAYLCVFGLSASTRQALASSGKPLGFGLIGCAALTATWSGARRTLSARRRAGRFSVLEPGNVATCCSSALVARGMGKGTRARASG